MGGFGTARCTRRTPLSSSKMDAQPHACKRRSHRSGKISPLGSATRQRRITWKHLKTNVKTGNGSLLSTCHSPTVVSCVSIRLARGASARVGVSSILRLRARARTELLPLSSSLSSTASTYAWADVSSIARLRPLAFPLAGLLHLTGCSTSAHAGIKYARCAHRRVPSAYADIPSAT